MDTLLEHLTHTRVTLGANPETSQHAPAFESSLDRWWELDRQEKQYWIDIHSAAARITLADSRLDHLVDRLSHTLLAENTDRDGALYTLYFENKRPGQLKRPVLSSQLDTMRRWVPSLLGSPNPALAAIGTDLQAAVAEADAAVTALGVLKQQNREFRTVGARKVFVDDLNALRKTTHGALAELPHSRPDLFLPGGFADLFFKPIRARGEEGPEDAEEMREHIAALEEQLALARATLAEMEATEAAEAAAEAQRAQEEALLAAAEKEAKLAAAKVKAMRAKLGV
ncbi:Hypothetical protein CAP_0462 [Chondromyces apiculatus DSM 436]|uniref:Uncharacterized protein n=2 Tax=Chondromyces apiculatus TaxID=51 RepID=A0A017SWC6_9BACT|nr:Hypothetical protein CAP_0462 [Chondromyces apiculatus DSM 436]